MIDKPTQPGEQTVNGGQDRLYSVGPAGGREGGKYQFLVNILVNKQHGMVKKIKYFIFLLFKTHNTGPDFSGGCKFFSYFEW